MKLRDCIELYFENVDFFVPVFTDDIYNFVINRMPNIKKDVFNTTLKRFDDSTDYIKRYQKGIYYKTKNTSFGIAPINQNELIEKKYIKDNKDIYGYVTGPTLFYELGLTTQIPRLKFISTNKTKISKEIKDDFVYLIPTNEIITKDNYRYLQLLDIFANRQKVNIKNINYKQILKKFFNEFDLDFKKLVIYSKKYGNKIFNEIIDFAEEL